MPSNSLNFQLLLHRIVQQAYNLYETLCSKYDEDKAEELLPRIEWAIVLDYNADRDFETSFGLIAEVAGLPATTHLFSQFVLQEKVNEWSKAWLESYPASANDSYVTLQPMQSPAQRRAEEVQKAENPGRDTSELWDKLLEGSDEPEEEITSSMINLQSAQRIADLSHTTKEEK